MRIALDFDGTVVENGSYPGIGEELPGAIDTLLRIQELGARIFLWTCRGREQLDAAERYLEDRGIILHPPEFLHGATKPVADLYIDDRGLGAPLTPKGIDWSAVGPKLIASVTELLGEPVKRLTYMTEVPVGDGESIVVYRTAGGGLFAVDSSYIEADAGSVFDPFDGFEYSDNELDRAEAGEFRPRGAEDS